VVERVLTGLVVVVASPLGARPSPQAGDIIHHNATSPTNPLPPLKAIIPTYPLADFSADFCQPRSAFDELLARDPGLNDAERQLMQQKCRANYIVNSRLSRSVGRWVDVCLGRAITSK
jgi:hypothetical protein